MFYTGRTKDKDSICIQKIGLATSFDLIHWVKYENNPLLEVKEHYHIDNEKNKLGKIGAFRGPDVFYHEAHGAYFMLISARESSINLKDEMSVVRIIEQINEQNFTVMGWLNNNKTGEFVGALSKSFRLRFEGDIIYKIH